MSAGKSIPIKKKKHFGSQSQNTKSKRKSTNRGNLNIIGNLKTRFIPKLPYIFVWWLGNKIAQAYNLTSADLVARRIVAALPNLNEVMGSPMPSFVPADLLSGLVFAAALYGFVWYKKKTAKKWRHDVEYGSARWGNKRDIEPYEDSNPDNNIILTATESLTLNSRPEKPKYARNKNVLVIGGSGSGKTRFFVKPNIMQCVSKSYPVSFIITDPKGGLVFETAALLKRKGYKIKILNTIDFNRSLKYNPFQYIHSEKDILKLVTALMENTQDNEKKGGDPFWEKAESLLYQALIGYIYYELAEEDRNMNTLVGFINSMRVNENDDTQKNAVDVMFDDLELGDQSKGKKPQPDHFAVRQYAKFRLAAGKTLKSILVMAGARLSTFDIKEVRELMSDDELELDLIGDEKTALFVVVSDTDNSFNFIPAIMYSQLFNILCDRADIVHGGRLPVHVRVILDEFANLGKIPKFDRLIATIRSREISACIILQTYSQLKTMYKDAAETIQGNCDTRLFLGGAEKTTLKDLTEALGKETVYLINNSTSRGQSASYSQNQQKLGKSLMSEDEIQVMDGDKCILQVRGVRPFFSDKFDITSHKHYKYLSDASPKNVFNVDKHINRTLEVGNDEEFTFFEFVPVDHQLPTEALIDNSIHGYDIDDFGDDLEPF